MKLNIKRGLQLYIINYSINTFCFIGVCTSYYWIQSNAYSILYGSLPGIRGKYEMTMSGWFSDTARGLLRVTYNTKCNGLSIFLSKRLAE